MLSREEAEKIALANVEMPSLTPLDRKDCAAYNAPEDAWCFTVHYPQNPAISTFILGPSYVVCVCPKTGQVFFGTQGE